MTGARLAGAPADALTGCPPGGALHGLDVGTARTSIDRIGIALATILGVAPLLPRGPGYLGWPGDSWPDLVVPALAIVWGMARLAARGRSSHPGPIPLWPWDLVAATVAGSAAFGLMADNVVTSPVFVARLAGAGELFRPMHQLSNPLYPLRIALTLLEGWIALRLVVAICRRADDPARRAGIALAGWGGGLTLVALFAVVQYVTRFDLHPFWVKANPSLVRAHATLDDPNALGACLALGLGLLVGLLRLDVSPGRRRWWAILLLVGTAGLVTTMSRSALGAVLLAPAVVLAVGPAPVTRLQRRVRTAARVAAGVVLVAVVGSMTLRALTPEQRRSNPTGPVDMIVKTFDPRESTGWVLRGRLPWWRAGVRMFEDYPVTGVGIGRFQRLVRSYGGGKHAENAHNYFLQAFAEAGLAGGVAFLALCVSVVWTFARLARHATDPWRRAVALGGLIGGVTFLLTLLTGHTLRVTTGQVMWATFVALAATIASQGTPSEPRRRTSPAWWAAGAAVLVAAVVIPPLAGYARQVGPSLGDWGYYAGLYGEERTRGGLRYRWTGARALVELDVPAGATALVVETAAVRPVRNGVPVRVRLRAAGASNEAEVSQPGRRAVTLPLPADASPGRVLLAIDVDPGVVPAESGRGTDRRTLGVQLFVPRFEGMDVVPRR
jgi:O-antigen ligase